MKKFQTLIIFSIFLIHTSLLSGQLRNVLSNSFGNALTHEIEQNTASSNKLFPHEDIVYNSSPTDSLEDLFPELKENKIKTFFELKAGIEVFRKIAAASFSLPLQFSEKFTLVPELSIIAGLQATLSYRYRLYFPRFRLNIQPGLGYFYFGLFGAPCALLGLSGQYILGVRTSVLLEVKTLFIYSDPNTRGLSVEGSNIIKYPPTSLSIGISF